MVTDAVVSDYRVTTVRRDTSDSRRARLDEIRTRFSIISKTDVCLLNTIIPYHGTVKHNIIKCHLFRFSTDKTYVRYIFLNCTQFNWKSTFNRVLSRSECSK